MSRGTFLPVSTLTLCKIYQKNYGTEKDLKRRVASLEKLRNDHKSSDWMFATLGDMEKEKNEFKYREKCLMAEIEYLEKVLKIKKHD